MGREEEVEYRRKAVGDMRYDKLLTDEPWFLSLQVDRLFDLFKDDFMHAEVVLDIGAGTCWFSAYMKERYQVRVLSLDVSGEAMELGKKLWGDMNEFFVGEPHQLADLGRHFSVVCCSAVLHHVEVLGSFYQQVERLLIPGGLFIAFNEPRSPDFGPLKWVHRAWFGRETRAYHVHDRPRSLSEYVSDLPRTFSWVAMADIEKSARNYRVALGEWAASVYEALALSSCLRPFVQLMIPEALVIAARKKDGGEVDLLDQRPSPNVASHIAINSSERPSSLELEFGNTWISCCPESRGFRPLSSMHAQP